jgi:hypothetical protein
MHDMNKHDFKRTRGMTKHSSCYKELQGTMYTNFGT